MLFEALELSVEGLRGLFNKLTQSTSSIVLNAVVQVALSRGFAMQFREVKSSSRGVQLVGEVILSIDSTSREEGLSSNSSEDRLE